MNSMAIDLVALHNSFMQSDKSRYMKYIYNRIKAEVQNEKLTNPEYEDETFTDMLSFFITQNIKYCAESTTDISPLTNYCISQSYGTLVFYEAPCARISSTE